MKLLQLTKGYFAKVDDEDYEMLTQWSWSATKCCDKIYAKRVKKYGNKKINVYLHRFLMNVHLCNKTVFCDHKDRDTLNYQKNNLRVCTAADNQRNKSKKRNGLFKYMGISKNKDRFSAQLTHNGKHIFLGTYDTQEQAALAYNKKKIELHGEFANLNIL